MPENLLTLTPQEMLGLTFACDCGKTHHVDIEKIVIDHNLLPALQNELTALPSPCSLLLVADKHTYQATGQKTAAALKKHFRLTELIYPDQHLIPDEAALKKLMSAIPENLSLLLAVGSGTINDLVRYASFQTGIPYMILCTAPSMDGYASTVSPLIIKGIKTTYNAVYPQAIWADIAILKDAPLRMLQAGLGDILGKYTSIADWKLAHLLFDEYYCEPVAQLVRKLVENTAALAPHLLKRSPALIEALINGLIVSGVTIGMIGSSRPASGEEHHFSHFCELTFQRQHKETAFTHGNYVGLGTEIVLACYDYLKTLSITEVYQANKHLAFTREKWISNIQQAYQQHAENIIAYKKDHIVFAPSLREERMQRIVATWDTLVAQCFLSVPSAAVYRNLLKAAGCSLHPSDIGLTKEQFTHAIIAAKDIRQRYGAFQLMEDIGLLEEFALNMADAYYY